MKRKTNKKSGIIAAVVGLSAVSLVSVGFASWVMSGGDSHELTGDISVDTVEDNRYFIYNKSSLTVDYGNNKHGSAADAIVFGIDDSTPIGGAWLTASSTVANNKYENLTASVELYVANLAASPSNFTATLTATNSTSGENPTGYYAALAHGYVGALPTPAITYATTTTNLDTVAPNQVNFRKVTISLTFAWGTTFNTKNPYEYYNTDKTVSGYVSGTSGQTWGDHARQHLLQLETDMKNVGFKLTITTTAA